MDDKEYRAFLTSVYERYVRPRQFQLRRRFRHKLDDEWLYYLDRAERAARLARFIEQESDVDEHIYRTFTSEHILQTIQDTSNSLQFANKVIDRGGYYDAIDAFGPEIIANLKPKHLPSFDDEVLRGSGSPDADIERRVLVRLAKARLERELGQKNEAPFAMRIDRAIGQLSDARSEVEKSGDETPLGAPTKSRKWFKGLGQIGQGAALSIANVAAAIGALHLPVSVETRTWGSIVSVVTGVGTIMNGIGDLRGE